MFFIGSIWPLSRNLAMPSSCSECRLLRQNCSFLLSLRRGEKENDRKKNQLGSRYVFCPPPPNYLRVIRWSLSCRREIASSGFPLSLLEHRRRGTSQERWDWDHGDEDGRPRDCRVTRSAPSFPKQRRSTGRLAHAMRGGGGEIFPEE